MIPFSSVTRICFHIYTCLLFFFYIYKPLDGANESSRFVRRCRPLLHWASYVQSHAAPQDAHRVHHWKNVVSDEVKFVWSRCCCCCCCWAPPLTPRWPRCLYDVWARWRGAVSPCVCAKPAPGEDEKKTTGWGIVLTVKKTLGTKKNNE